MMSNKSEAEVLFERIGAHVALVTLNRPQVHNAVNGAVAKLLHRYTGEIEADPTIRAAVLAGNGASFCAGLDLKAASEGRMYETVIGDAGFAGFVFAAKSKPWIAAVHGMALGGGTELALACDMIVAGEKASFALPEVKRGLIAGAGGAFRIARALPRALAIEMVVTGDRVPAERAYALGLVNRLVALGEEVEAALAIAATIGANAPTAVRESLSVVRHAADLEDATIRAVQDKAVKRVLASPDVAEGAKAFVEKRAPVWAD